MFSDAKEQRTQLSMVRFDPISNSFEMSCMSLENDWLKKKTPRKGRDTVFFIIEFSSDLSQNLVQPSPILLCMRSSHKSRRYSYLSRDVRKPDFCICENKDADQLRGNREADQRLCFRYTDSAIPLLSKS